MRARASSVVACAAYVVVVAAALYFTFVQVARGDQNFARFVKCEDARLR